MQMSARDHVICTKYCCCANLSRTQIRAEAPHHQGPPRAHSWRTEVVVVVVIGAILEV